MGEVSARARSVLMAVAFAALAPVLWSLWERNAITTWIAEARPVPFFAAMALLPTIGVPVTPFFVVAGAAFGGPIGVAGSLAALALHLVLCHRIARGKLRPRLESLVRRFGREVPDFSGGGRDAVRFTVLVKLAPGLPAFAKTYALGIAGVPFALYFGFSMAITGAYACSLVLLGDALLEHDRKRTVAIGAAVLVLAVGIVAVRRRRARERSTTEDG